jgi:hypothetical protein
MFIERREGETTMELRPAKDEYAPYFERYIERIPPGDLVVILEQQFGDTVRLLKSVPPDRADFRYAPGKWSLREVVGHLADTERIMAYRALRIARGDETPLSPFDENTYVPTSGHALRSMGSLIEELQSVRRATLTLFGSFTQEAWLRGGTASGKRVTVRALGCVIAGHELHHREIITSRYLSMPTGA